MRVAENQSELLPRFWNRRQICCFRKGSRSFIHSYIYRERLHYIYIYIWSPPKIYTRLFHTIPQVASLHWSTTHICRKHREYRYNRAFRHVHGNRAATSRGFDMFINLAPDLGRRFMIVYVPDKLKCWRACYFVHVVLKSLVFFAFYSVLWCVY